MPAARVPGLQARRVAWQLLRAVICRGRLLNEALGDHDADLAALPAADRALAEHIVRTTLRHRGQLQHLLTRFLHRPLPRRACPAHAALLMGAAQLLAMRIPAHAALATTVELIKRTPATRHLAALANAVLRRLAEQGEALLQQVDATRNFPRWLRHHLQRAWGSRALNHMAAELLRTPPLDITVKDPRETDLWAERLQAIRLPTGTLRILRPHGTVTALPGHAEGAWWVQDAAAALPVPLLGEVRGREVADLCAAPGGKTAQLAARGAEVTAVDVSARRLARLRDNLARLQLGARIITADVRTWQPPQRYDAVLLDAPCTATGTFRRHPDVLFARSESQLRELLQLQRQLLARAASMLRPGGVLVYCVCSLLPQEGEEQIARFLDDGGSRTFTRLPVRPAEVGGLRHMLTTAGEVRTLPHHPIGDARGMDGFFIARLQRRH